MRRKCLHYDARGDVSTTDVDEKRRGRPDEDDLVDKYVRFLLLFIL